MADRANENHECWPSYERLEKDTSQDRKTVSKNIRLILERGYLEDTGKRKGKTGQTKVYRFTFKNTKNGTVKASQKRNSSKNGTLSKSPKNGTHTSPKNGTLKESQKRDAEPPSLQNHPIEPPNSADKPPATRKEPKSGKAWEAYSKGYINRYGHEPARNQSVNAMLCKLVDFVGPKEAPWIAWYYLQLDRRVYVEAMHPLQLLIRDYQSIRTQLINRSNKTSLDARTVERRAGMASAVDEVKRKINAGEI